MIEWVLARLAADAVSSKQSVGHTTCERAKNAKIAKQCQTAGFGRFVAFLAVFGNLLDCLDGDDDHGGCDLVDPEQLRGVDLNPKIVPAGSEPGKVDEGFEGLGANASQRFAASAHRQRDRAGPDLAAAPDRCRDCARAPAPLAARARPAPGTTSTITVTSCGLTSRTEESIRPTVTTSRTLLPRAGDGHRLGRRIGQLLHAGSRAPQSRPSPAPRSPGPTTKPGAGSPSIGATTGTTRRAFSPARCPACRERPARPRRRTASALLRSGCGTAAIRAAPAAGRPPPRPLQASRRLSSADDPRSRTSTLSGGSPTTSSCVGILRNSSGTRRMRSTTCSPATVSHSRLAQASATNFRPR